MAQGPTGETGATGPEGPRGSIGLRTALALIITGAIVAGGLILSGAAGSNPTKAPLSASLPAPGACGLPQAAFCDTFGSPFPIVNRSGQLDGTVWGVSRVDNYNNLGQGIVNAWLYSGASTCNTAVVAPPADIQVCNGQLVESVHNADNGETVLAAYPKQPFDFAGRVGKVVFDVGNDSQSTHAAWPEFAMTDLPVPAPSSGDALGNLPGIQSYAANAFYLDFSGSLNCPVGSFTVNGATTTTNYVVGGLTTTYTGCALKSTVPGVLNHFELDISASHIDVWATDPGQLTLKLIAMIDGVLPLSRGFVWIEDFHYNACKFDTQCQHTFIWDNVGFDGPVLPRDLGFDVPDGTPGWTTLDGATNLAYSSTIDLHTGGSVTSANITAAAGAVITFNAYAESALSTFTVTVNGHPHTGTMPTSALQWPAIAFPVALSDIVVGSQTINIAFAGHDLNSAKVSNVDLKLIAAGGTPSTTTPTPIIISSPTVIPTSTSTATPIPAIGTPTSTPVAPSTTSTPPPASTPTPIAPKQVCTARWGSSTVANFGQLTQAQCAAVHP